MTRFLIGVALGAGVTAVLMGKGHRHEDLGKRTRSNIERTGQALQEMTDRMHRSEQLLHEAEEKASRVHRHTRSLRRGRTR